MRTVIHEMRRPHWKVFLLVPAWVLPFRRLTYIMKWKEREFTCMCTSRHDKSNILKGERGNGSLFLHTNHSVAETRDGHYSSSCCSGRHRSVVWWGGRRERRETFFGVYCTFIIQFLPIPIYTWRNMLFCVHGHFQYTLMEELPWFVKILWVCKHGVGTQHESRLRSSLLPLHKQYIEVARDFCIVNWSCQRFI